MRLWSHFVIHVTILEFHGQNNFHSIGAYGSHEQKDSADYFVLKTTTKKKSARNLADLTSMNAAPVQQATVDILNKTCHSFESNWSAISCRHLDDTSSMVSVFFLFVLLTIGVLWVEFCPSMKLING